MDQQTIAGQKVQWAPAGFYPSPERVLASVCRSSYEEFVKEFWDEVPGAGKCQWGWHMTTMCSELQEAAERVFREEDSPYDLVINVCFGTSKSTVASILFQPWTWTRMPSARHINATHTQDLVLDFADKSLEVIKSAKFKACFPEVRLRRSAVGSFANTLGGDRLAATVGGKTPTGFHAHFQTVDDPIDPKKALSQAELDTAAKFMTSVLPSRKVNKLTAFMCLVMQRLTRGDPTDVVLETAKIEGARKVRRLVIPGEITTDVSPPELKGKYTADGLMDPVRLPRAVLNVYKATLGAYGYAGQVLQAPVPPGGGMFKEHWFNQRCPAAPYNAQRFRYWDRAATADGGCFTAGVLLARAEGNWYVEHVEKGQWEPDERNRIMRAVALRDRIKYGPRHEPQIWVEAEGGSSGRDAWKSVARALNGFAVFEDNVTGSKDVRAEPWASQCAALNVWLVDDGTWDVNGYVQEHVYFKPDPTIKRLGKYKDQVDGSSGAYNKMVGAPTMEGTMRILRAQRQDSGLHIVVMSKHEAAQTVVEDRSLLVSISNPGQGITEAPTTGIVSLIDWVSLEFADIDPAELQDKWEVKVEDYDKLAREIIIDRQTGKRLWSFLLKKRDASPKCIVVVDDGDRRALSVAFGVCRSMRLPLGPTIYVVKSPDWKASPDEQAPNPHVCSMVESTREMVAV